MMKMKDVNNMRLVPEYRLETMLNVLRNGNVPDDLMYKHYMGKISALWDLELIDDAERDALEESLSDRFLHGMDPAAQGTAEPLEENDPCDDYDMSFSAGGQASPEPENEPAPSEAPKELVGKLLDDPENTISVSKPYLAGILEFLREHRLDTQGDYSYYHGSLVTLLKLELIPPDVYDQLSSSIDKDFQLWADKHKLYIPA